MSDLAAQINSILKEITVTDADIDRALLKAGTFVRDDAFLRCPTDTGKLKNSIVCKVSNHQAHVGTSDASAPFVEFGTGRHRSSVGSADFLKSIKDWCHRHGIDNWFGVVKAIRRRGTKAHPFLRPAVDNNEKEITEIIGKELFR